MAVINEHPYIDDMGNERTELERHYSDCGKTILQVETGVVYSEAVDVYPCRYTYTETEEDIPAEEMEGVMTDEGKGNSGSDCTDKT